MKNCKLLFLFLILCAFGCNADLSLDISKNKELEKNPRIHENLVTWDGLGTIYLYDISSKKKVILSEKEDWGFESAVYNPYVVRVTSLEGKMGQAIVLTDLSSNTEHIIVKPEACKGTGGYYSYTELSIYKKYLAYIKSSFTCDYSNGVRDDVIIYNIDNGLSLNLTEDEEVCEPTLPVVWETKVYWIDKKDNAIVCYDVKANEKEKIKIEDVVLEWLDIYKNIAVFTGSKGGNESYVYALNLTTNEIEQLGHGRMDGFPSRVAIYDNLVVWESGSIPNIYMFNLSSRKGDFIDKNKDGQIWPDIWGNYVVWIDTRVEDLPEVFLYNIDTGEVKNISKK